MARCSGDLLPPSPPARAPGDRRNRCGPRTGPDTPSAASSWSGTRQVLYSITKHAMRRSADEIGATSISSRPKVFSDATSVVDGIFSAHRVLHDKNQPRSRRLRACIEGMMNALGVGERLAEIRKSRKISQAKFAPRRRRRYDPELRARTQQAEHNAPICR